MPAGHRIFLLNACLLDFVELPPEAADLCYGNMLCGVVRGALEMIQKKVKCEFVRDMLKGDPVNEIRVELLEVRR